MNPIHVPPNIHKDVYHFSFLRHRQKVKRGLSFLCMLLCYAGCDSFEETTEKPTQVTMQKGEFIGRLHDEYMQVPVAEKQTLPFYPWKVKTIGNYPRITKEHFRCKGKCTNPDKLIEQAGSPFYVQDCAGTEQHSLPLREQKEFIYPILINLLNFLQASEKKPVIVTSGHRCPDHNRYSDSSTKNQYSKHLIGAEVSFYIKGLENSPEKVIALVQSYFLKNPGYQGLSDYQDFKRWDKQVLDVTTPPWYNKEIFIKLYHKNEGRNCDNDHPYPYISIQVRYDRDLKERVSYSWDKAFGNFWRW